MSKRKQSKSENVDDDGGNDSDISLVDVDFEFFDPNPAVDYLALKRLVAQLFQSDVELFAPHALAELILAQPLLGTTVKTDGIASDPYACVSVLNVHVHQNHPSIKALTQYVLAKSAGDPAAHATLQALLGPEGLQSQNHVGFVFSERLINMPVQVVPHMYRMLADEIQWANDENEPYTFTHYLVLTRTYRLTPEQLQELEATSPRPSKRHKNREPLPTANNSEGASTYSFHPEDEYIQKHAIHTLDFPLTTQVPREPDSFGLDTGGRMMLIPAENLRPLIEEMSAAYAVPQ